MPVSTACTPAHGRGGQGSSSSDDVQVRERDACAVHACYTPPTITASSASHHLNAQPQLLPPLPASSASDHIHYWLSLDSSLCAACVPRYCRSSSGSHVLDELDNSSNKQPSPQGYVQPVRHPLHPRNCVPRPGVLCCKRVYSTAHSLAGAQAVQSTRHCERLHLAVTVAADLASRPTSRRTKLLAVSSACAALSPTAASYCASHFSELAYHTLVSASNG